MSWLHAVLAVYVAGFLVGALTMPERPLARLVIAAFWPLGLLAFPVVIAALVIVAALAFPLVGVGLAAVAALVWWIK